MHKERSPAVIMPKLTPSCVNKLAVCSDVCTVAYNQTVVFANRQTFNRKLSLFGPRGETSFFVRDFMELLQGLLLMRKGLSPRDAFGV